MLLSSRKIYKNGFYVDVQLKQHESFVQHWVNSSHAGRGVGISASCGTPEYQVAKPEPDHASRSAWR